ncbi:Ig-like domain-containing protein [Gangjinia marincola]|uniref:Ig-like domain-containing protein n=1 Tax=Gangjinia marincola TaxID=578463 RepID=A0ABN1MHE8_9FLAO
MKKQLLRGVILMIMSLMVFNCAKRGNITGGPKDETPPKFIRATPPNYSINFDREDVRLYFDEYIKLKNAQRQIIISPPLDPKPDFSPLGIARKYAKIFFSDTLRENTTYTINFGYSIVDNNEENPLPFFKYVFSTGDYLDSLKVNGNILDAYLNTPETFITVALYEVNEAYNDSLVYTDTPTYITNTLDSTTNFSIENIKEGTYKLIAFKDMNENYRFDPATDKIGFREEPISLPGDSLDYTITLFQEELDLRIDRPKQVSNQHFVFPFYGNPDSVVIEAISNMPQGFESAVVRDRETDTLNYWFKPPVEMDSILFRVENANYLDTLVIKPRTSNPDSLQIQNLTGTTLALDKKITLSSNIPLARVNDSLIRIVDKDTIDIPFTTKLDNQLNELTLDFEPLEDNRYQVDLLPGALIDFLENKTDSLAYSIRTKKRSDYGTLNLTINNIDRYPVIVQLTTDKGIPVKEVQSDAANNFDFELIDPGTYLVRVIYDDNANGQWDTGSFLNARQAETILYDSKTFEVRANWDVTESISLPGINRQPSTSPPSQEIPEDN